MSAEMGYTLNRVALLREARKVTACRDFRVESSHHRCESCGKSLLEHIIVAQRSKPTVDGDPSGGVRKP